jgi:hypothetical protein
MCLTLTSGQSVLSPPHLCRYKLPDAAAEHDIQRFKASGRYSLAGGYSSSCQAITDVAAANSFMSTLLLLAFSNRSIQLVDAATMQVCCNCHFVVIFALAHKDQAMCLSLPVHLKWTEATPT